MLIFNIFIVFILTTAGLLFSILAYSQRNKVFFYLGIAAVIIVGLGLANYYEFYYYSISSGDIMTIALFMSWVISIVFLIISQTEKKKDGSEVTDAFLDDIINAEDEEWDPES